MSSSELRIKPFIHYLLEEPIPFFSIAPKGVEKASAKNEITQLILNAIQECNSQTETALSSEQSASLAGRLGQIAVDNALIASDVTELLAKGYLKVNTFMEREGLVDVFAKVMNTSFERYDEKFPEDSVKYPRSTTLKVIAAAFDNQTIAQKGKSVVIDGEKFYCRLKAKRAELYAFNMDKRILIRQGEYLTAFSVMDLCRLEPIVLKKPNIVNSLHIDKMVNEKRIIKEIHSSLLKKHLPIDGIKATPYAMMGLAKKAKGDPNGETTAFNEIFLLEPQYDGELYDHIENWNATYDYEGDTCFITRFDVCRKLLNGLKAIHEAGYGHGDIKLENILVKTIDEVFIAHISDLGDASNPAMLMADPDEFRKRPIGVHSLLYNLPIDIVKGVKITEIEDLEEATAKAILYRQRRDVFAMGMVIATILSGSMPFDENRNGYPDYHLPHFERPMRSIVSKDKFEPLKNLIWKMLDENSKTRISASLALEELNKIGIG